MSSLFILDELDWLRKGCVSRDNGVSIYEFEIDESIDKSGLLNWLFLLAVIFEESNSSLLLLFTSGIVNKLLLLSYKYHYELKITSVLSFKSLIFKL